MAFFYDPIVTVAPPASVARARHLGATATVMRYAPRRLRPNGGDPALVQAEADAAYWRRRAFKAETELRALETRLQSLAARAQERGQER